MITARKTRLRLIAAAAALTALAVSALPAAALPAAAQASSPGYDQITGLGPTASAITVPWTQGILDNTNTPIASANADRSSANPTSPVSFMYGDFKNLTVTVSQTQDLGQQGVTVSWTGGQPTVEPGGRADFLQMMECWGDATTGPTPEQCEYGAPGLQPGSDPVIGQRGGQLCTAGAVPSTTSPPSSLGGSGPAAGCDTQEPSDPTHTAPCPGPNCNADDFYVPFSPVTDPADLDYNVGDTTYYNEFNSNEVEQAVTSADGTGQQQFETLTGVQAPGLGCGQAESGNSPRGCWLVIVPRGQYEPNGFNVTQFASTNINTSPLSASNWAQRIQIHLDYSPVGSFCPIGTMARLTVGTQLAAHAVQSWDLALNQAANCTMVYGYSPTSEAVSTQQLTSPGSTVGLAFTTIPIGSEATRDGSPPPTNLPKILYAPVAVSALDFGFNINLQASGYYSTPVKLTPLLLAKALTQSYRTDLPDYYPYASPGPLFRTGDPGPAWAQGNPINISEDPAFQALNPELSTADPTGAPLAPLLTEDHSALNQQIWRWVQASSAARTWLGGTPDASDGNMMVDPDYQALNLGQGKAIDFFPRAYTGNFTACEDVVLASPSSTCPAGTQLETKTSLDLLPYTDNYDSATAAVLTGTDPSTGEWNYIALAPNGSVGWWNTNPPEPVGQRFIWAADDTSDLAAYGLIPAQMCNDAGASCVSPSVASVTEALHAARPDRSGLLHVNPARPGNGGYPLVDVTYAAVRINQSAAALLDYANLITYAAGQGQTPGAAAGDLPPGYLPLPSYLRAQARAVAAELRALARAQCRGQAPGASGCPGSPQ